MTSASPHRRMSALRLSAAARSALAGCLPSAGRLPAAGAAPVLAPALVLAPAAALAPAAQEERRVGRGLVEALLGDAVWWKRTTPKKRTSHSRSRIKSAQWRRLEVRRTGEQRHGSKGADMAEAWKPPGVVVEEEHEGASERGT